MIINIPSNSSYRKLNQSTTRFSVENTNNKKAKKKVESANKLALNFIFCSSFLSKSVYPLPLDCIFFKSYQISDDNKNHRKQT